MVIKILNGDCRDVLKTLPDKSIHCCVTSPPYYGLRDYGTAKWEGGDENCKHYVSGDGEFGETKAGLKQQSNKGSMRTAKDICPKCGAVRVDKQIGLEQSPEEYVQNIVEVFREVKRVLRDDGTLWLNLGDSYWGGKGQSGSGNSEEQKIRNENGQSLNKAYHQIAGDKLTRPTDRKHDIIKPKDLIGIPWMVAFALRADGWHLRQDIIWAKNNPMPESVKDRCTKSHEYIFLLSKSQKYYFDNEAIKEESVTCDPRRPYTSNEAKQLDGRDNWHSGEPRETGDFTKRNKRSVWKVNTKPYKGAHFATFNLDLIDPCLKAGTSEKGVCSKCGSPWVRVIEKSGITEHGGYRKRADAPGAEVSESSVFRTGIINTYQTVDWKPSCSCDEANSVSATVLDPFGGSGTVGQWCNLNGRNAVLIELNPEYIPLIEERINTVPKPSKKKLIEFSDIDDCLEDEEKFKPITSIEELENSLEGSEQDSYYNLLLSVPFEHFDMVRKAYWVDKGVVV